LLRSRTLRNHAEASLAETYESARRIASSETGLEARDFPSQCPYTLDDILQRIAVP
jgi:hypothetical protein